MIDRVYAFQSEIFKALSHPIRLKIIQLLRDGERCVCEIVPALGMEQPSVSRHLAILKKEGILSCRKEGLKVIYKVKDPQVFQLLDGSLDMLKKGWEKKNKMLGLLEKAAEK